MSDGDASQARRRSTSPPPYTSMADRKTSTAAAKPLAASSPLATPLKSTAPNGNSGEDLSLSSSPAGSLGTSTPSTALLMDPEKLLRDAMAAAEASDRAAALAEARS